jgi:Mg2+-importing ATPase
MRIIMAKDLFVNQSALTGESAAVEKFPSADQQTSPQSGRGCCLGKESVSGYFVPFADKQKERDRLTKISNLAFMGSTVFSGSATGVVVAVGEDTIFGEMA